MFWGHTLKQGETLNLSKEAASGVQLHLSHISLSPDSKSGATTLFINHSDRKFAVATLEKDTHDFDTVDLYFTPSADTTFSLLGAGEVNLLGYIEGKAAEESESSEEGLDQEAGSLEEDSDGEESESEEEIQPVHKSNDEEAKPAKQPSVPTKAKKPPQTDPAPEKKLKSDASETKPAHQLEPPSSDKPKKHSQKQTKP